MLSLFRERPRQLLLLVFISNAIARIIAQDGKVLPSLSCVSQQGCPLGKFCAQPQINSSLPGICEDCWKPCILPNVYGSTAVIRCRCRLGRGCLSNSECGPAEFCAVLRSRQDLPTCQPCTLCRNDSQSFQRSCAARCPSGSLDANGVPPEAAAHFVFLVYDIGAYTQARAGLNISANGSLTITEDSARLWLGAVPPYVVGLLLGGLPSPSMSPEATPATAGGLTQQGRRSLAQLDMTFSYKLELPGAPRTIALGALATQVARLWPREQLCPRLLYDPTAQTPQGPPKTTTPTGNNNPPGYSASGFNNSALAARSTVIVPEGCPCNATADAASFRCPSGHICSPAAWLSLPGDVVSLGSVALLKARCVPCSVGSFCPEATFADESEYLPLARLDCPAGQFCPAPNETLQCPAGYFCPLRSTQPITCNFSELIRDHQLVISSRVSDAVAFRNAARRLLDEREPLRGNYCPEGSVVPYEPCSPGSYCPTPAEKLLCPQGHYCWRHSIQPMACPWLTRCLPGSAEPVYWPLAVFTFLGLAGIVAIVAVTIWYSNRLRSRSSDSEERSRRARARHALQQFADYYCAKSPTASSNPRAGCPSLELKVENLCWEHKTWDGSRTILEDVTATFKAGELSAIMGPSGGGKSTLLALLAGHATHWPPTSGNLSLVSSGSDMSDANRNVPIEDPMKIKRVAGFVPQDDVLYTDLTVRENLEYSAALRLPRPAGARCWRLMQLPLTCTKFAKCMKATCSSSCVCGDSDVTCACCRSGGRDGRTPYPNRTAEVGMADSPPQPCPHENGMAKKGGTASSQAQTSSNELADEDETPFGDKLRDAVEIVLSMLALTSLESQIVGGSAGRKGISGGQRKRVSIGLELITQPAILFLDEPTSGLDASCASEVMNVLLDQARTRNVNVITVLHQPRCSAFHLLDTIMLLNGEGRVVYHGTSRHAAVYFQKSLGLKLSQVENPADWLLDIISGKVCSLEPIHENLRKMWLEKGAMQEAQDQDNAWPERLPELNGELKDQLIDAFREVARAQRQLSGKPDGDGFDWITEGLNSEGLVKVFQLLQPDEDALQRGRAKDHSRQQTREAMARKKLAEGIVWKVKGQKGMLSEGQRQEQLAPQYPELETVQQYSAPGTQRILRPTQERGPDGLALKSSLHLGDAAQQLILMPEMTAEEPPPPLIGQQRSSPLSSPLSSPRQPPTPQLPKQEQVNGHQPEGLHQDAQAAVTMKGLLWALDKVRTGDLKGPADDGHETVMSYNATKTKRLPSWGGQFFSCGRRAWQQWRRAFWPAATLEVAVHLAAAAAVGLNQGRNWSPTAVPGNVVMAMLVLAVLSVVQHLRTFSANRAMLDRERNAGLFATAFFTAKCLVDVPWILTAPIFFTLPYYILTIPRAPFKYYYAVSIGVWWIASGLAYVVTLLPLLPPAAAPTVAILLTLISGALLHGINSPTISSARGTFLEGVLSVSFSRWAAEALTISELDNYMDTHMNVIAAMYQKKGICRLDLDIEGSAFLTDEQRLQDEVPFESVQALSLVTASFGTGYCDGTWRTALVALYSIGAGLRLLALLILKYDLRIGLFIKASIRWIVELMGDVRRRCRLARGQSRPADSNKIGSAGWEEGMEEGRDGKEGAAVCVPIVSVNMEGQGAMGTAPAVEVGVRTSCIG